MAGRPTIPLHPWFFAAFPVIRLYAENLTDVEPNEVVVPLLIVLAATSVAVAILGVILRDLRKAAIITSAVVLPVMLFGLALEQLPRSFEHGRLLVLTLSVAFVAVAAAVALKAGRRLGEHHLRLSTSSRSCCCCSSPSRLCVARPMSSGPRTTPLPAQ